MITIAKKIPYTYGDSFKIKPLFDIHYGHSLCDINSLKKYLEDSDENTYFVTGGDLVDSIITTDKRYRKSIDNTETEEVIDEQINGLCKILEPYKERIINVSSGNHEDTIIKQCNTNPSKRIAEKLDVPYSGLSCFIKLNFSENNARGRTVVIYLHHGFGGGSRTQGGALTKFSRELMYYDADIYLFGHVHTLQADEIPRLGLVGKNIICKNKVLVICGTFKKSLTTDNTITWEQTKGFPPTRIGGATITIQPNSNWVSIKTGL